MTDTDKLILDKLDELGQDVNAVMESVVRIEDRTACIEERTTRIEERTTRIEDKTASIEERTTRIEDKTASIEERTTRIEDKTASIEERTTRIEDKTASIEERTTRIEISIENDISKKIDIIGEGHDFLKQRLDDALQMEKKRETMELELVNLRMKVKKIETHLDIA